MLVPVKFHYRVIEVTVAVGRMSNAAIQRTLVQNDTGPKLRLTLQDSYGNPLNLVSGVQAVNFYLRPAHADDYVNVGHEACSGFDLANGVVDYAFQQGDLSGTGTHFGDVELVYDSGEKETSFDEVRFLVRPSNHRLG